ncbi:MAG: diguanylate cyclase [Planctomycetota bacterium]
MINQTFEELKLTGKLPSPPGVGMKILKLTADEDCSAHEIGQTIMADSALTGRLLKIANSAQSAGVQPIATVSEATMRIGVRSVRNVALGLSLVSAYRSGICAHFDYDRYWSVSLARAVAAQRLGERVRFAAPAEAYVIGLLCQIGRLALATVHATEYSALLESERAHDLTQLRAAERRRFEIDHAEISAHMLSEWGLPEVYGKAVQIYEDRGQIDRFQQKDVAQVARLLNAAELVAEICGTSKSDESAPWKRYASDLVELSRYLDFDMAETVDLCNRVAREWTEWGKTLNIPTLTPVAFQDIEALAQAAPRPLQTELELEPQVHTELELETTAGLVERKVERKGLRVLAVDDDPMSLKLLERTLALAGHQVQCAKDGNEALQIALDSNPQVVIADWMMPNLDGIELCKSLRRIESGRDMFFLLLTGRGEEDRIVEAFDAGVDDYVVKPFNPKLLMARIKGGQRVIELKERVENDKQTMMRQVAELGLLTRKLRTAALTDLLTELPNRRYSMKRLEQEWESSLRTGRPLSVIMIDIDHFKQVNDVYGHDIGDVVLKETAGVLRSSTRQGEDPARLGGEEFIVVCTNTNAEQARACAERLRVAVESHHIQVPGYDSRVTVSLGVAERVDGLRNSSMLLKAADEAVYAAKSGGRNRVQIAPSSYPHVKSA